MDVTLAKTPCRAEQDVYNPWAEMMNSLGLPRMQMNNTYSMSTVQRHQNASEMLKVHWGKKKIAYTYKKM